MRRYLVVALTISAAACALSALAKDGEEPVRTGWAAMYRKPYDDCTYLEVTGPGAAKRLILERAKKQYKEPDEEAIKAVDGRVTVRVANMSDRACARGIPTEAIFVDKKTDAPALRVKLDADVAVLQNGFGAEWSAADGVGTVDAKEFASALRDGKYKVVIVNKDGSTRDLKAGGVGKVPWSGDHTKKVLGE